MNTVRRPIKWERGNFYIEVEHIHDSVAGDMILTVVPMGSVRSLIDPATDVGRGVSQMVRTLEIGGIVGTTQVIQAPAPWFAGQPSNADNTRVSTRTLLCSDREFDDGTPAALSTNWFTSTTPISILHETQDEQQQFPTRIHHQSFVALDNGQIAFPSVSGESRKATLVVNGRTPINKRLRLRLQDDEVLVWHCASFCSLSVVDDAPAVRWILCGTIFYRVVM